MAIQNRNLEVGTVVVGTYKKERYECRIGEEDGRLSFVLGDGRRFKSASAAASAVMGGKAVNGWLFWSLDGTQAAEEPRSPKASSRGKLIRRLPNQRGTEERKARYWCNACMKSFIGEADELPAKCPAGHTTESERD